MSFTSVIMSRLTFFLDTEKMKLGNGLAAAVFLSTSAMAEGEKVVSNTVDTQPKVEQVSTKEQATEVTAVVGKTQEDILSLAKTIKSKEVDKLDLGKQITIAYQNWAKVLIETKYGKEICGEILPDVKIFEGKTVAEQTELLKDLSSSVEKALEEWENKPREENGTNCDWIDDLSVAEDKDLSPEEIKERDEFFVFEEKMAVFPILDNAKLVVVRAERAKIKKESDEIDQNIEKLLSGLKTVSKE